MIIFFLIGVILVTILWDLYVKKNWSKGLVGNLSIDKKAIYAGEDNTLTEVVENRKWLPLPILEVGFQTDKNLLFHSMENTAVSDNNYKRDIFSLLGRQRITRRLTMTCPKRGYYEIPNIHMISYSFIFHKQYLEEMGSDVSFYVYPKRIDVSRLVLGCEGMLGNIQCAKRLYEDPFAFQGIREYTTSDPMKTVNWKASARSGQLMVNTFESTKSEQVMIYLDIADRGIRKQTNLVEELISVAGSLSQRLIKAGTEVGIKINDAKVEYLPPKSNVQQRVSIEQMLAKLVLNKKEEPVSFAGIVEDIPKDVMPVFLSKDINEVPKLLGKKINRDQQAIWVLMTDEKNVELPDVPSTVQVLVWRPQI